MGSRWIEAKFRRQLYFILTVVKTGPLGLDLQHAKDGSCQVAHIAPNGLISKWNYVSEPMINVFVGDRIAAANQASENVAWRIAALKNGEQLSFTIKRQLSLN